MIACLGFSPDGQVLAAGFGATGNYGGEYDSVVKLWEVDSGRELRLLKGHRNHVVALAFSPNGKTLATASYDRTVRLWSVATGEEMHRHGGSDRFECLAFSPDGRMLVTGSGDGTIRFWVGNGVRRTLHGHANLVAALAFSPDGRTMASSSWDRTIKLWDPISGRETRSLPGARAGATWLSFSPDGNTLVTGDSSKAVRLWQAATRTEIADRTAAGHVEGEQGP
jgi:WD40 repeat protein